MSCIGDFSAAMEFCKAPHSSLEVVKDTIPIALNSAYLGKIKNAIATVLNANLQIHSSHLKGIPIAYDRQNVKMLSGSGDILSDQPCVHFTIKTSYVVFKPKIGDIIKGMVNKKGSLMIGCLVHEFFYCSVNCTQAQSDSCQFGDDVLFQVDKLEEDGHGILSIIGSFIKIITSTIGMETDSGIDEKESTCNVKSPNNDASQEVGNVPDSQQDALDSVLASPEVEHKVQDTKTEHKKKKKKKKSKKHKKKENLEGVETDVDEGKRKKKKKKHKKEKKHKKDKNHDKVTEAVEAMLSDAMCAMQDTDVCANTTVAATKVTTDNTANTSPKKKQKFVVTNSLFSKEPQPSKQPQSPKKGVLKKPTKKADAASVDSAIDNVVKQAALMSDGSATDLEGHAIPQKVQVMSPKKKSKKVLEMPEKEETDAKKNVTSSPKKKPFVNENRGTDTDATSSVDQIIESVVRKAVLGGASSGKSTDKNTDDVNTLPNLNKKTPKKKPKEKERTNEPLNPDHENFVAGDTGSCDMFKTDTEVNSPSKKPKKGKKRKLHDSFQDQLPGNEKVAKTDKPENSGPVLPSGSSAEMAKYYLAQMGLTLNADGSTSKNDSSKKQKKAKRKNKSKDKP